MYTSKCTCTHRHPSQNVRAWNFTHSPTCYYATALKQERDAQENRRIGVALYKHYRRAGV